MPLEQVQVAVDGIGQVQLLHQEVDGVEAATMQLLRFVPHLVVEVAVAEHAPALLGPLLFAQASLDAALAILEASSYLGFHLKYLHGQGRATFVTNSFPCKCRGISSFFTRPSLRKAGDTLVHGLADTGHLPSKNNLCRGGLNR